MFCYFCWAEGEFSIKITKLFWLPNLVDDNIDLIAEYASDIVTVNDTDQPVGYKLLLSWKIHNMSQLPQLRTETRNRLPKKFQICVLRSNACINLEMIVNCHHYHWIVSALNAVFFPHKIIRTIPSLQAIVNQSANTFKRIAATSSSAIRISPYATSKSDDR